MKKVLFFALVMLAACYLVSCATFTLGAAPHYNDAVDPGMLSNYNYTTPLGNETE